MIFSGNFIIFNQVDIEKSRDDQNWYFGQIPATMVMRGSGIGREAALYDGEGRKNAGKISKIMGCRG